MNTNNNSTQRDPKSFRSSRFVFESLEKFVVMDVFLKVSLGDLKYSFSKILGIDFFSKQFEYYFLKDPNNPSETQVKLDSTAILEEDKTIQDFIRESPKELYFKVLFREIGA